MRAGWRVQEWMGVVLLWTLTASACGSSGSTVGRDGGGGDRPAGTVSEACMYVNQDLSCQTFTASPQQVASEIKACKTVLLGTQVASCPDSGVLGKCINLTADSTGETSTIYYYQADGSILTLDELCSTAGTYVPAN
jgi:hypothetical protein